MASLYMSPDSFLASFLKEAYYIISTEKYSSLDFSNIAISSIIFQGFNLKAKNFKQTLAFILFIEDCNSLNLILEAFLQQASLLTLKNYIIVIFDLSTSKTSSLIYIKEQNQEVNKLENINLLEAFKKVAILEGYRFQDTSLSKLTLLIIN